MFTQIQLTQLHIISIKMKITSGKQNKKPKIKNSRNTKMSSRKMFPFT